jgi:hypothetical protein
VLGGHSSMGAELTVGFTVTGLLDRAPVTLAGGQAGDALILTKPIGSGVILAGEMQGKSRGADVLACWEAMARAAGRRGAVLAPLAHAMTDVTGFGLMGTFGTSVRASGTGAELSLDAVPLLPGALALAERGVRSSLVPAEPRGAGRCRRWGRRAEGGPSLRSANRRRPSGGCPGGRGGPGPDAPCGGRSAGRSNRAVDRPGRTDRYRLSAVDTLDKPCAAPKVRLSPSQPLGGTTHVEIRIQPVCQSP